MSLFARLVLLVLVALLPAIGVQAYTAYEWRRDREADLREEALRQATMIAYVDAFRVLIDRKVVGKAVIEMG